MNRSGFGKLRHRAWKTVRGILMFFAVGLLATCLVYAVFAIFFRTDTERRLVRENRMYRQAWGELAGKEELVSDAVASLQHKDSDIYSQVFHSNAPNVDPMASLNFLFASDSIPDVRLLSYTEDKADSLLAKGKAIDAAFDRIFRTVALPDSALPPMTLPLKDITYPQVGASTGRRMNPFYNACVEHDGIDLIVISGTPVYAAADGIVGMGTGSRKGAGNFVEILHDGGYVTCYAHLGAVYVSKGQRVRCGQKIGTVGMTGKTYAPHLHYGILRDGECVDPVNYFFASVSPAEYANMLYMAVGTMQSMD